jgi:glutamyl-Q tRNA(Asp) synthetase
MGHAYSALLNQQMARAKGGRLLLRIEDIDTQRCTPELVEACFEDLAWLGIEWEEPVLRQSREFERYRAAGPKPTLDPDGAPRYPGICQALRPEERAERIERGEPFAMRLDGARAGQLTGPFAWQEEGDAPAHAFAWGDVVIVRKDILTSYHLSVVLDDAMQGVTHIVRGLDLFEQTAIHRMLHILLALPEPVYHHHRLILDRDGKKLAKSAASTPLRDLRAAGMNPADLQAELGF